MTLTCPPDKFLVTRACAAAAVQYVQMVRRDVLVGLRCQHGLTHVAPGTITTGDGHRYAQTSRPSNMD
jgi:hypothetical protein